MVIINKMDIFIKKNRIIFLGFWLPFIVWALVIFSFSANPAVKTSEVHWQDFVVKKTAHLVEYFIFSLLLYRALVNSQISKRNAVIYTLIAAFCYGATDELHQSFTPGREPRLRDVMIDATGSLLFVLFLYKIMPLSKKLMRLAEIFNLKSTK
jgi:VanZ like family